MDRHAASDHLRGVAEDPPIGLSVPIGVEASGVTFLDRVYHAILPAVTLSITGIANIAMHTREKMVDICESDYVVFCKSKR